MISRLSRIPCVPTWMAEYSAIKLLPLYAVMCMAAEDPDTLEAKKYTCFRQKKQQAQHQLWLKSCLEKSYFVKNGEILLDVLVAVGGVVYWDELHDTSNDAPLCLSQSLSLLIKEFSVLFSEMYLPTVTLKIVLHVWRLSDIFLSAKMYFYLQPNGDFSPSLLFG